MMETAEPSVAAEALKPSGSWLHYYANPGRFLRLAKPALPWLAGFSIAITAIGLVWGYGFAPADWEQGDAARIMSRPPGWRWRAMRRWQSARFSR
jgi:heme exporter protein C